MDSRRGGEGEVSNINQEAPEGLGQAGGRSEERSMSIINVCQSGSHGVSDSDVMFVLSI